MGSIVTGLLEERKHLLPAPKTTQSMGPLGWNQNEKTGTKPGGGIRESPEAGGSDHPTVKKDPVSRSD